MRLSPKILILIAVGETIFLLSRCQDPEKENGPPEQVGTPYELEVPDKFPQPNIPADNPLTVEGVILGRYLFYEKKISSDQSMSCGSCHMQQEMFNDKTALSTGVNGAQSRRRAMPLFNLAFQENFFWDGRAASLEAQAHDPITNPDELGSNFEAVIGCLEADTLYPPMFEAAFGSQKITKERILKAIAQFERTIISAESKFDRVVRLETGAQFTLKEKAGFEFFKQGELQGGGDCFHCHGHQETSYLMGAFGRDLQFANNGLKKEYEDKGLYEVTGNSSDIGKFKIPSLRNLTYAPAFMHDGSIPNDGMLFPSLIEFYKTGGHPHPNIDPNMQGKTRNWSQSQMENIGHFLRTLTDYTLLGDSAYANPHKN